MRRLFNTDKTVKSNLRPMQAPDEMGLQKPGNKHILGRELSFNFLMLIF